ncbi:MAG: cytochrome C oxidase subunit I, partial [Bdellovibrionales bacterium]|nr:cytochrome C oxidase subunit I [Bdellovibrionales bacterium]
VGGTALSFMAVSYYVLPLIFRKRVAFWGMAKFQPWVFGLGISVMAMAKIYMGIFGVPRRHWDISFSNAPFSVEFHPAVWIVQAIFGVAGLVAVTGALMFVAIAVVTVFFGKPMDEEALRTGASGIPQGILRLPKQVHEGPHVEEAHKQGAKGTVVFCAIFFVCFVLYYFVNWKILSFLWKVG